MDDKQCAGYIEARGQQSADHQEDLVRRVQDAKAALKLAMGTVREEWIEWDERSKQMLADMRLTRMALDAELGRIMAQLKDVRQFFLSATHDEEVRRLREFVELCERLQALKVSGFLDSVVDTILKLDTK